MPHSPWPFFKATRDCWYVEINRRQVSLGKHPTGAAPPVKVGGKWQPPAEILKLFYQQMAEATTDLPRPTEPSSQSPLVLEVLDQFLAWTQKHRSPGTYKWYRERLQSFSETIADELTVDKLKVIHVENWIDRRPDWGVSQQRGCKSAVQRAMNWAEKVGLIEHTPLRHMEKPAAGRREQLISQQDYEELLAHFQGSPFHDILVMAWHTGARPQEIVIIETNHCDLPNRRIVLPPHQAKGKKKFRVIYLNDTALALVQQLSVEHPEGIIFLNARGRAWTAAAVYDRFSDLQRFRVRDRLPPPDPDAVRELARKIPQFRKLNGVLVPKTESRLLYEARQRLINAEAKKHGSRFMLYAFRHSFAQRLLEQGTDALTVSTLLGHTNGAMLAKVYSHMNQNADYLLKTLNRSAEPNEPRQNV
jgi:integrase